MKSRKILKDIESGTDMKKKIISRICMVITAACFLTGCGNAIPELTEEEVGMISTYAADMVLPYSDYSASRLVDTEKEAKRREEIEKKAAEVQAAIDAQKQAEAEAREEAEDKLNETEVIDGESGGNSAGSVGDIAGFLGLEGIQIEYAGYEIASSYPNEETDEWQPAIDATTGKSLLIVKLNAVNNGGAPVMMDVLSGKSQFAINGDEGIGGPALTTMLLNDFAYAKEEIGAGESVQYVLITQVDENITTTETLSLYMKQDGKNMTVKLQ